MESSKRAMKFEQQERDVLEGLVHVENQLQSDFLNECTPHQGNGKILFTEYKGEPKGGDSLDQMIMSREAQLEAKAEVEKAKKNEQMVRENMAIAAGRKAKDAYAQHSMYTNECSDL